MLDRFPLSRRPLSIAVAVVLTIVVSPALYAEDPPGQFEVHDLSLWIIDPGGEFANARSAYPSALPVTVNSARTAPSSPAARRTAPINLITFHGRPTSNLDVDLRTSAGAFLAHWPLGDGVPNRLRWVGTPAFDLVDKIEDPSDLVYVDADDWIVKARQGDALYVKRGARSERFLAYDVELKLAAPIRLEGGPDKYTVINTSEGALYDVLVSRPTPQGRRVAWIDELPPNKPPAPAAGPKPDAPNPQAPAKPPLNLFSDAKPPAAAEAKPPAAIKGKGANPKLFGGLPKGVEAKAAEANAQVRAAETARAAVEAAKATRLAKIAQAKARAAAAAAPAAEAPPAPAVQSPAAPSKPAAGLFGGLAKDRPGQGVEVTLSEPLAADAAQAKTAQVLSERLAKAGLSPHEIDAFASHYGSLFFEGEALVVACRLNPAVIDEKIPLSIFPMPAKTVRVAMVIVRNADPELGGEVERLIAQLGNEKFAAREAAQKRLTELGPLAFPALQTGVNQTDQEIAIRCERILLNQGQTPGSAPAARGNRAVLNNGVLVAPVPVAR